MTDHNAPPLNPLPPIVWLLALPMIAMEVVLNAGGSGMVGGPDAIGWRVQALQAFAFAPDYLRQMISLHQYPLDGLRRLISYPLVHTDATQATFVVVIFLALGKFVGEVFSWWALLAIFLLASVMGALAYAALPMTQTALIGGYPPIYGMIGAYTFVLWVRQAASGGNQLRAFQLIGFLLGFQMVFAVGTLAIYGSEAGVNWTWVADLAGFATGFLMSFVVSPGGWVRVLGKIRALR
ncbi:MAG: rhomboid family intramembrane serine protease [Paracoccaceae bacterium]